MTLSITLVSCANARQAEKIARALVEERLAACATVLPGSLSLYRWKGRVRRDREALILIKSRDSLSKRIERRVLELHSYETPEILRLPLRSGSRAYVAWLLGETAP